MLPKFNDKGDVQYLKGPRDNGKSYAEERRLVDTYYEYYLEDKDDIIAFVELFVGPSAAVVAESFMNKSTQIENPVIFEGPTKI